MRWLKNFERLQELQQQVIWRPIVEMEPRSFIPEVSYMHRIAAVINHSEITAVALRRPSRGIEWSHPIKKIGWGGSFCYLPTVNVHLTFLKAVYLCI